MATFKIIVLPEKSDKTYLICIQLYHMLQKRYISTGHHVTKKQLHSLKIAGEEKILLKLKDEKVILTIYGIIKNYTDKLLTLPVLNHLTIDEVKEFLLDDGRRKKIDFIDFGKKFIAGQNISTGKNTMVVLNALINYWGSNALSIYEFDANLLNSFVAYLRSERSIKKVNNIGKETIDVVLKPMGDTGVKDYVGKLKQIFIAARKEYNDEDKGKMVIQHYPFRNFKMPKAAIAKKRNLKPDIIKLIRDTPDSFKNNNLGRDVFMLSFYLVGMNIVDMFKLVNYKDGRISYNRSKTESRKGEKSFISIKVEPEATVLIEKYKDPKGKRVFNFYKHYNTSDGFLAAVNDGLKYLVEQHNNEAVKNNKEVIFERKVTSYFARGAWSNIAWNDCKISKDTIAFAFNHSDPTFKVTDLYIEEDYSNVDKANRKVLDKLLEKKSKNKKQ